MTVGGLLSLVASLIDIHNNSDIYVDTFYL